MLAHHELTCAVVLMALTGGRVANGIEISSQAQFEPQENEVVVLMGDQVTEQSEFTQHLENFLLTRFAGRQFRVINGGHAGDWQSTELSGRIRDISVHRPTVVIVFPSLIESGDGPIPDALFQAFTRDLFELDRAARELSAELIYISPLMFDARAAHSLPENSPLRRPGDANARLAYYGAWLRDFAAESSARFVDLQGPLHRWTQKLRGHDPEFTFFPDGRHPSATGTLAIACTILEDLGLEHPLATIHISREGDQLTVYSEGGRILNAAADGPASLSFLWIADALPWTVPAELQSSADLLNLAARFNQETLRIPGLGDGRYQLLIDDELIGNFTAEEFAEGIPLERFVTPPVEQSRKISQANMHRTRSFVRPARAVADSIGTQEQVLRDLADSPESILATERRKSAQRRLAELQAEKRELDAAAGEAWNALQEISQPAPRRFVIRPVPKVEVRGRVLVAGMPISGATVELHGIRGVSAGGTTDAMGFFKLNPKTQEEILPGEAWLVVLSQMVLPKFVSLESSGYRVLLRAGINEIELHFEEMLSGE